MLMPSPNIRTLQLPDDGGDHDGDYGDDDD